MSFSISTESNPIVHLTLEGVVSEEDLTAFLQALDKSLRTAETKVAFVIDMTTSDGGSNKHRKSVAETFAARGTPWGRCAGMAVVTQTEGHDSFLRGVLASGPIPFPYRFFQDRGEAVIWLRSRLRAQ